MNKVKESLLVSVIIPVYNVESYLHFTVEDVINQTYKQIEIIMIDDGSTDSCGAICDEYKEKDNRIVVFHTENHGLSAARNLGLDNAHGQYIYFLDSDDRIHTRTIELLLMVAENEECDIVQAGTHAFTDDNSIPIDDDTNIRFKSIDRNAMCEGMMTGDIIGATVVQNKLYNKRLFDDGLKFPVGRIHEDVALTYKLFWKARQIIVLENKLFYYRSLRKDSITHAPFSLARLDALTACEERYTFFNSIGEKKLCALAMVSWCDVATNYIKKLKESKIENKQDIINTIKHKLKHNYNWLLHMKEAKAKSKLRVGIEIVFCIISKSN